MKGAKANLGILGFGTLVFIFFWVNFSFFYFSIFLFEFLTYYKVFFFNMCVCVCPKFYGRPLTRPIMYGLYKL